MRTISRLAAVVMLAVVSSIGSSQGAGWKSFKEGDFGWLYEEMEPGKTCRIKYDQTNPPSGAGEVTATVPSKVMDGSGKSLEVVEIANEAFSGANGVHHLTVPEGVLAIGANAFSQSSLKSVSLPASVVCIDNSAFGSAWDLQKLTVAEGNKTYCAVDGMLFSADKKVLILCLMQDGKCKIPGGTEEIGEGAFRGLRRVEIVDGFPSSLKAIGKWAFWGCEVGEKLVVPSSVVRIGSAAFSCLNLKELAINGDGVNIGESAFSGCAALESVTIQGKEVQVGARAFGGLPRLKTVKVTGSAVVLGNRAFSTCLALTEIKFPEGLTAIGEEAFSNCWALARVDLPEGLTSIGRQAFFGCTALKQIKLPEGLVSIGAQAFFGCTLTGIRIPASVAEIGGGALACSSLNNIEVDGGSNSYCVQDGVLFSKDMHTLVQCLGTMKVNAEGVYNVPAEVTAIDDWAFNGIGGVKEVNLPDGLKTIGECAFKECNQLKTISVPRTVIRVGSKAFNSSKLEKIFWWPGADVEVRSDAFNALTKLYVRKGEMVRVAVNGWFTPGSIVEGFVVTFADEKGAEIGKQDVMAGEKVKKPTDPARAGYTFKGWFNGADGYDFGKSSLNSDLTLKQQWELDATAPKDLHTVTFLTEGGSIIPSVVVKDKARVAKPTDPSRLGFVFNGWYTDNGKDRYNFDSEVTGDLTLKAKWEGRTVAAFLVVEKSENPNPDATPGASTPVQKAEVTVTGKGSSSVKIVKLSGRDGQVSMLLAEGEYDYLVKAYEFADYSASFKVEKAKVTVKVELAKQTYTVTFDTQGGAPVPPAQTVGFMGQVQKPDGSPWKKGFVFEGWYLDDEEYNFDMQVASDIRLVARWKDDLRTPKTMFSVTFDAAGGEPVPAVQQVAEGGMAVKPYSPAKKGFEFVGWYLGSEEYVFSKPVTSNITLVARWKAKIKTFAVTFDAVGGLPVPAVQRVADGERAVEPSVKPEKGGYTFEGWYLGSEKYDFSKPVTSDITLVARWKEEGKTAVESRLLAGVRVEGNPFMEKLALDGMAAATRVEVYSLSGAPLYSQALQGASRVEIAAAGWPSGVYVVRVIAADGARAIRVVKR